MNIAVLTHFYNPDKPQGLPDAWPWRCVQEDDRSYPEFSTLPGVVIMSVDNYPSYIALHQAEMDEYQASL